MSRSLDRVAPSRAPRGRIRDAPAAERRPRHVVVGGRRSRALDQRPERTTTVSARARPASHAGTGGRRNAGPPPAGRSEQLRSAAAAPPAAVEQSQTCGRREGWTRPCRRSAEAPHAESPRAESIRQASVPVERAAGGPGPDRSRTPRLARLARQAPRSACLCPTRSLRRNRRAKSRPNQAAGGRHPCGTRSARRASRCDRTRKNRPKRHLKRHCHRISDRKYTICSQIGRRIQARGAIAPNQTERVRFAHGDRCPFPMALSSEAEAAADLVAVRTPARRSPRPLRPGPRFQSRAAATARRR